MASAIEITGDVTTAATALAGLVLVFLGSTAAAFDSYTKVEQKSVRNRYQTRGRLAFGGFVVSAVAAVLAILAKWLDSETMALWTLGFLGAAFVATLIAAFVSVKDIA